MRTLDDILKNARDLPTLPSIYSALCEVVQNPRSTADDMAAIIMKDQASSGKILKVVNSAFYSIQSRVDTVSRAVMFLGFDEVCNLVLASSVINLFSKNKALSRFNPPDFWAHSIAVGMAARLIGQAAGAETVEHFFVAGILHDIGKLLFLEHLDKEFARALDRAFKERRLIREAESEAIGMDHAAAGGLLARRWKIPTPIVRAILWHHAGLAEGNRDLLTASVHVADYLARSLELGFPGDDLVPQPNPVALEFLNLPPGFFRSATPTLLTFFEETRRILLTE